MSADHVKQDGQRATSRKDRRETILSVAGESFLTNGYAGTTMSAVAATLGGSKSTLWSYFPSKAALFEAAIDHAIAAHHEQLSESLVPCADLVATLVRFATKLLGTATSPKAIALQRLVQAESGRFLEVADIFYRRVTRRTRELLADFLAASMTRDLLRSDSADIAARIFIALCMSGSHQQLMLRRLDAPTPQSIAEDAELAIDVFLRAYRAEGD